MRNPYFRAYETEHVLRGRVIEPFEKVSETVTKVRGAWDPGFWWCNVSLPYFEAQGHYCLVGSPGSGKTTLIRLLMEAVMPGIGKADKIPPQPVRPETQIVVPLDPREIERRQRELDGPSPTRPLPPAIPCVLALIAIGFLVEAYMAPGNLQDLPYRSSWAVGVMLAIATSAIGFLHHLHRSSWVVLGQFLTCVAVVAILSMMRLPVHAGIIAVTALLLPAIAPAQPIPVPEELPQKERIFAPRHEVVRNPAYDKWYQNTLSWPVESKPHRAFIYDGKLESAGILETIKGFEAPVYNLDPFHTKGYAWDIAKDIDGSTTAIQIASILIPEDKHATNKFFPEAARSLMASTFKALHFLRPQSWTFRDAVQILKSRTRLIELLNACPETRDDVETFLSGHRDSVGDVMATIGVKIALYEPIAALWEHAMKEGRAISLSEWVKSESVLLVANDKARNSSLDAINRAIFNRSVELLLSEAPHDFQPGSLPGRTWFILDEAREAGILEKLTSLMTTGRQYGACVVIAFQDIEGMRASFGEKEANEITGLCSYKALLRIDSPQTAAWASEVVGEYEAEIRKTSYSEGMNESQSTGRSNTTGWTMPASSSESSTWTRGTSESSNEASDKTVRKAALASEFMNLPKADPARGVSGIFVTPFGTFKHTVVSQPLGNPRFDRHQHLRPVSDQKMTLWDAKWDFVRLGVEKGQSAADLMAAKRRRDREQRNAPGGL